MDISHSSNTNPIVLIIFGITGHLASKKIIPSLWQMYLNRNLHRNISIVGFGRRELTQEQFHDLIRNSLVENSKISEGKAFLEFCKIFTYQIGTFEDIKSFENLTSTIIQVANRNIIQVNKLFCLAVPPSSYESILTNLKIVGLNLEQSSIWSRVMLEKPFGVDSKTAEQLENALSKCFSESQIYRIDHYLFKEVLAEIENYKRENLTFGAEFLKSIEIRILETLGVEDRGNFYDSIGTLRDIGQNHMLNMLSTIVSDESLDSTVDEYRRKRSEVIDILERWSEKSVQMNTQRSQYIGYRQIEKVNPESKTETYFNLHSKFSSKNPKWSGVEVILQSGKRMNKSIKEIVFNFKNAEKKIFKIQSGDEYSKMFRTAMRGDQKRFVSGEEIKKSWEFIDPIEDGWKKDIVPLEFYNPN